MCQNWLEFSITAVFTLYSTFYTQVELWIIFFVAETLRALYLADNDFETLPADFGKLVNLQIVSVHEVICTHSRYWQTCKSSDCKCSVVDTERTVVHCWMSSIVVIITVVISSCRWAWIRTEGNQTQRVKSAAAQTGRRWQLTLHLHLLLVVSCINTSIIWWPFILDNPVEVAPKRSETLTQYTTLTVLKFLTSTHNLPSQSTSSV